MASKARKIIALIALTVVAVFAGPMAANAAYVPAANITVTGSAAPGGTSTVCYAAGSFTAGETVSFAATGANLNYTATGTADGTGALCFSFTLPANASGSYLTTATGLTSGNIATATITVAAADAGGLAATGVNGTSILLLWGGGGVLLLGAALLVVMGIVRRQRANA